MNGVKVFIMKFLYNQRPLTNDMFSSLLQFQVPKDVSPNRIIYNCFKASGLMNQEGRPWSIIYTVYHITMLLMFGTAAALAVMWNGSNLKQLILGISSVIIFAQVTIKAIKIMTNQTRILKFLNSLEDYRLEVLQDKERVHIVIKADEQGLKLVFRFLIFFVGFPFFSFIISFTTDYFSDFEDPHLVMTIWVPWSMNELWPYIAGNIYISWLTISAVLCYGSFSVLQFLVTFQMSAYLRVLQNRIETNGPQDKQIYYHHKTIIQLLNEYNRLFSGVMYQEVVTASLQPCGYGYAIIKSIKRYESGTFDLVYKFLMAFTTVIMCTCGEVISNQVEKLHESSYSCKWYEEKPKERRDIFAMMLVTTRPITVNYKLFVAFNFACLTTIVQGIYSYLTLILNFDEN